MVIAQIIGVNIQLYFNCRFLKISISTFLKHQIYSITFFILLASISKLPFFTVDTALLNFILSGVFYTLLVIIGVLIFPKVFGTTRDEIKTIFQKTTGLKH
jgi:hypothetical protein